MATIRIRQADSTAVQMETVVNTTTTLFLRHYCLQKYLPLKTTILCYLYRHSFLEPSSYADAVFRSFDGYHGKQGNGLGVVSTSSPSSSSDYLKISVTDPQKEQDLNNLLVPGGNTFVTYLITTWTNLTEFNGTEFNVRRWFKDVVTLSDRLSESF